MSEEKNVIVAMKKCNYCNEILPKVEKEILCYMPCPRGVARTYTFKAKPCFVCHESCRLMGSNLNGWVHKKCFEKLREEFLKKCGNGFWKDLDAVSKHYLKKHEHLFKYGFDGLVAHWLGHERDKCKCSMQSFFDKWETK